MLSKFRTKRKDKGVVLYHAMTAYHFLESVGDKLYRNKDDFGVLLISKYLSNIYPNYTELIRKRVFDKVEIYDIGKYANCNSTQEYEEKLLNYYDDLLSSADIKIEECKEIHIAGAHQGFGSYVTLKNLPFYFYEEGAGILSKSSWFSEFEKNTDFIRYEVTNRHGLFEGTNNLIIEARCVLDAQTPGYSNKKAKNFDIVKVLKSLSENDVDTLLDFFKVPSDLKLDDQSYIIMGENLKYEGRSLSGQEFILLYQRMMDYYIPQDSTIVLKPHPADKSEYDKYMENAIVLRSNFPSELLALITKGKFQAALTISSTSVKNLDKYVRDIRFLHYAFLHFSTFIHRINIAFEIMKLLKDKYTNLFHFGINNDQVQNLVSIYLKDEQLQTKWLNIKNVSSNSISVIDNIRTTGNYDNTEDLIDSMKKADANVVFIFLNQDNDYSFYDVNNSELMSFIVPVIIKKKKLRNNILEDLGDEVIYVFCKDEDVRERVRNFHYKVSLRHTGISLEVEPLSNEELEIQRLSVRISVTENKLKKLISKN